MPIQGSLGGSSSFSFGRNIYSKAMLKGYVQAANGKYYKYYSTDSSFSVAQAACNADGGWLAIPLNSADNSAVRAAALSANPIRIWLGITDIAVEGVWRIASSGHPLNGQNAPYFNWNTGEPNNSGDEDYAEMYISGVPTGLWNDTNPSLARPFVGEWYF